MIYLDANATTPVLPEVALAMAPFASSVYGNPSSKHPVGAESRRALERSRSVTAEFLSCAPGEIVFTASGTESVCLAFNCALRGPGRTIVHSTAEHACVLEVADIWEEAGTRRRVLPVSSAGTPDPGALDNLLKDAGPAFVSLIWVNNETGVVSPVHELAEVCRRRAALLHVDAVQAVTRVNIDLSAITCDYLSLSAHKFHGPKGAGALFLRTSAPKAPVFPGNQEFGLRAGTQNVMAIAGLAAALEAQADWRDQVSALSALRDEFESRITRAIPSAMIHGREVTRVANTTNLRFPGRSSGDMVAALGRRGVCASAGAACSTGDKPSHVIMAMGLGEQAAIESVRFSIGRTTTSNEIETATERILAAYNAVPESRGS